MNDLTGRLERSLKGFMEKMVGNFSFDKKLLA